MARTDILPAIREGLAPYDPAAVADNWRPYWDGAAGQMRFKRAATFHLSDYFLAAEADDTGAVQRCLDAAKAAGGTADLRIGRAVNVSDTITLLPASGPSFNLNIVGDGRVNGIKWMGASNKAVFHAKGWKDSSVHSLNVQVPSVATTNVIAWDLDADAERYSLAQVRWYGCRVSGARAPGMVGWRIGHVDPTGGDFSSLVWVGCIVNQGDAQAGTVGWLDEGTNSLQNSWLGCFAGGLAKGWSNRTASGSNNGNAAKWFTNCGTSGNLLDFDFAHDGNYKIAGGRFENGKRFLHAQIGVTAGAQIAVEDVSIIGYTPADDVLFYVDGSSSLYLGRATVRKGGGDKTLYASTMLYLAGSSVSSRGVAIVEGCAFQAADPFFTSQLGNWSVVTRGNRAFDAVSGLLTNSYVNVITAYNGLRDVLMLGSSGSVRVALQPPDLATGGNRRGALGFNLTDGATLDGGPSRGAMLQRDQVNKLGVLADGRAAFFDGVVRSRKAAKVTGVYAATTADAYLPVDTTAAVTINLPSAASVGAGHELLIKDVTGGAAARPISVVPAVVSGTSDRIDLAAGAFAISSAFGKLAIVSDGASNWEVVGSPNAATSAASALPADAPAGAVSQTLDRSGRLDGFAPASGTLYVARMKYPVSSPISKATFITGSTGYTPGTTTPGRAVAVLLDEARNVLAVSGDLGATAKASDAAWAFDFTTAGGGTGAVTPAAGAVLYVGLLQVAGTGGTPAVAALMSSTGRSGSVYSTAPVLGGTSGTGMADASGLTVGSTRPAFAAMSNVLYAALL